MWPEIEKMVAGLQDGMPEAFEMLGVTLSQQMRTVEQSDMYMAVMFELLPLDVQEKMLADLRVWSRWYAETGTQLGESTVKLTSLHRL